MRFSAGYTNDPQTKIKVNIVDFQISENDGLPGLICQECIKLTLQSYRFRKLCESSDAKLRYFSSNSVKDESNNMEFAENVIKNPTTLFSEVVIEETLKTNDEMTVLNDEANKNDDDFENMDNNESLSIDDMNYCPQCNKHFNTPTSYKRHMNTHMLPKSLSCDICQKTFSRAFDVQRHMTRHTGQRPYNCQYCKKSFTQSGTLSQHMRTHSDIIKEAAVLEEKKKKIPRVRGKSHLCSFCGKSFRDASNLTIHVRRHTGDKPYNCTECPLR